MHSVLAALMSVGVVAAHAEVTILVNPGDQGEQSRASVLANWKSAVGQGLRKQRVSDLASSPISPFDMTADLSAVRARVPDVVVGPSHLIGSAVAWFRGGVPEWRSAGLPIETGDPLVANP